MKKEKRKEYRFESKKRPENCDCVQEIQVMAKQVYTEEQGYGFHPLCTWPELNTGFVPIPGWEEIKICQDVHGCYAESEEALRQAGLPAFLRLPLSFKINVEQQGNYRVTVVLYTDVKEEILLFAGRRQLVWKGVLEPGRRYEISALQAVHDIVPRGEGKRCPNRAASVTLLSQKTRLASVSISKWDGPTLFIAGDSTVTDQSAEYPYAPDCSYSGWGQMLPAFTGEAYAISNHAHSGLTTESFRQEGHYEIMMDYVTAGDYCLFQFGHNDQKRPHLQAHGGYREHLQRYIREVKEKQATPILVTPLARNSWKSGGREYHDLLIMNHEVMLELGAQEEIPVLDLHTASVKFIQEHGLEEAKRWFYPSDYTHTNDFGGFQMAEYIWLEMVRCGLFGVKSKQETWAWIPPLQTERTVIPKQLTAAGDGKQEQIWEDVERPEDLITRAEALDMITRRVNFFPINVYNDIYEDVIGHEWYAGAVECAVQNELIPEQMVKQGCLFPEQPITLEEFLWIAMTAYQTRKELSKATEVIMGTQSWTRDMVSIACTEGLITKQEAWDQGVSRKEAAQTLKTFQI